MGSCTIYKVETHDQVLSLWRSQGAVGLCVAHLDFHCDMRGMLVDRGRGRAYPAWDIDPSVGQGNFLTHAVMEGRVASIHWVHDEPGGRRDDVGTVAYESDLSAQPRRWLLALRGEAGVPLRYRVTPYARWSGLADGEVLDIDWDLFASTQYAADSIPGRAASLLAKRHATLPAQVFVSYSPGFCHPSRGQFDAFVARLATVFDADVVDLMAESPLRAGPMPWYKRSLPPVAFHLARRLYYGTYLALRRRGIY